MNPTDRKARYYARIADAAKDLRIPVPEAVFTRYLAIGKELGIDVPRSGTR